MLTHDETIELAELESKLCPPSLELDERDHIIAMTRTAFDTLLWDIARDLMIYVTMKENLDIPFDHSMIKIMGEDKVTSGAIAMTNYLNEKMKDDGEPWEVFGNLHLRAALSESHCGDCVAFPCTCTRCWAEEQYNLPFTATWTKSEGCTMFYRMIELQKKSKLGHGSE
jgi:hypothetical protein